MKTFGERLDYFIKFQKLSKNQFAKELGVSATTVTKTVDGLSKPNLEFLESIFSLYPTLSKDWLIDGEGDMLKPSIQENIYVAEEVGMLRKMISNLEYIVELQRSQLQQLGKLFDVLVGQFFGGNYHRKYNTSF